MASYNPTRLGPEEKREEQLYLLEVLVDRLEDEEGQEMKGSYFKVRVQFLNFPCIEIGQEDFQDSSSSASTPVEKEETIGTVVEPEPLPPPPPPVDHFPGTPKGKGKGGKPLKGGKDGTKKGSKPASRKGSKGGSKVGSKRDSRRESRKGSRRSSRKGSGRGSKAGTPGKVTPVGAASIHQSHKSKKDVAETIAQSLPPGNRFSSGKSCLFPMVPLELIRAIQRSPVQVHVYEGAPANLVGSSKIRLTDAFREAVALASTPVLLPVSAFLEESFPLTTLFQEPAGTIKLFLRLSCFGATIFTPFGYGGEDQCYNIAEDAEWTRNVEDFVTGPTDVKGKLCPLVTAQENLLTIEEEPCPLLEKFRVPVPWRRGDDVLVDIRVCGAPKFPEHGPPPPKAVKETGEKRERGGEQATKNMGKGGNTGGVQVVGPTPPPKRLVCTCPRIPELLQPAPEPPCYEANNVCECANILAALQNPQRFPVTEEKSTISACAQAFTNSTQQQMVAPVPIKLNLPEGGDTGGVGMGVGPGQGVVRDERGDRAPLESLSNVTTVAGLQAQKRPASLENVTAPPAETKKIVPSGGTAGAGKETPKKANVNPSEGVTQNVAEEEDKSKKGKKKRKLRKEIYAYTAGMYPGVHIGHKYCLNPIRMVPKTMGWLWNIADSTGLLAPRRGWRPGAISLKVAELFRQWKRAAGLTVEEEELPVQQVQKKKVALKRMRPLGGAPSSRGSPSKEEMVDSVKPTFHLHKKDGFYYITMYPPRNDSDDEEEDPQPVQFKVDVKKGSEAGSDSEDSESSESSTEDSLEIEFTAPSAMKKRKPRVDKANMACQYNLADLCDDYLLLPKAEEKIDKKVAQNGGGTKVGGKEAKGKKKK